MAVTLCDEQDIKNRLNINPGDPLPGQYANWTGPAKEASVVIEGFTSREWSDLSTVPEAVRIVASRMTVRSMSAPTGPGAPIEGQRSVSSTFGPMAYTRTFSEDAVSSAPFLSKGDKLILSRYVARAAVYNEPMWDEDARLSSRTGYDYEPGWSSP